jgi:hypothetical protein
LTPILFIPLHVHLGPRPLLPDGGNGARSAGGNGVRVVEHGGQADSVAGLGRGHDGLFWRNGDWDECGSTCPEIKAGCAESAELTGMPRGFATVSFITTLAGGGLKGPPGRACLACANAGQYPGTLAIDAFPLAASTWDENFG